MLKKKILDRFKEEYASGKTQEKIARMFNIAHPAINRILCGKRTVGGLTLDTVEKMFPRMSVNLDGGDCPVVSADHNSVAVNASSGGSNNFFHNDSAAEVTEKIISAVMASDKFDPAAKVELYNIVQSTRKK